MRSTKVTGCQKTRPHGEFEKDFHTATQKHPIQTAIFRNLDGQISGDWAPERVVSDYRILWRLRILLFSCRCLTLSFNEIQTFLNKQNNYIKDCWKKLAIKFCIFVCGNFLISGINTCPIFFDKHYGVRRLSGLVMGFI